MFRFEYDNNCNNNLVDKEDFIIKESHLKCFFFKKYINIQAPSKKFAAYSSSYPNLKRASFCIK